jgi:hypothetical protein
MKTRAAPSAAVVDPVVDLPREVLTVDHPIARTVTVTLGTGRTTGTVAITEATMDTTTSEAITVGTTSSSLEVPTTMATLEASMATTWEVHT